MTSQKASNITGLHNQSSANNNCQLLNASMFHCMDKGLHSPSPEALMEEEMMS
jgi:hypothetical protein